MMSKKSRALTGLLVAFSLVGVACSDAARSVTAPNRSGGPASEGLIGDVVGGVVGTLTSLLIPPVKRNVPLPADVTWSFVAGPSGATSANAAVGLVIVVPPRALSSSKTITVTALKGAPIAYKFEPHGLVFSRKVVLTQDLRGT